MTEKQERRIGTSPESWRGIMKRALTGTGSRSNAIKAQCGECNGFDRHAITDCTADACPLWHYRPFRKGSRVVSNEGLEVKGEVSGSGDMSDGGGQ